MGIDPLTAGRLQGAKQPIAPQVMIGLSFGHCICRFGPVVLRFRGKTRCRIE